MTKTDIDQNSEQDSPRRSLRQEAFISFDLHLEPVDVVQLLGIKPATAYRYHQAWKHLPPGYSFKYQVARTIHRKLTTQDKEIIARVIADKLGTSKGEVLDKMAKPWALKQLVIGEWMNWELPPKDPKRGSLLKCLAQRLLLRPSHEARIFLELITSQEYDPLEDDDDQCDDDSPDDPPST